MRRARAFMASPTATVDTSPVGHQRVQTSTICAVERPRSLAARTSGQVLASDTRWRSVSPIISTDERRATKRGREDIAVAGVARCGQVVPAQGFACHSRGVEVVGLLAHGRGWPAGAVDLADVLSAGLEPGGEASAPAATALDHPAAAPIVTGGELEEFGEPLGAAQAVTVPR